jgi:non-specific serine/threonine protein kinase
MNKGLSLYRNNHARLKSIDKSGDGWALYQVKSDTGYSEYNVQISNFKGNKPIKVGCSCPYDWGGACKHIVAAVLELDESGILEEAPELYSMLDAPASLPEITDEHLKRQVDQAHWKLRNNMPAAEILTASAGTAECSFKTGKQTYTLRFVKSEKEIVHTVCSCAQDLPFPLCLHKLGALLTLRNQFGIKAFEVMRDWTEEKNKLLAPYGFSADQNLSGKFDFKVNNQGVLVLSVLDTSLRSTDALKKWLESTQNVFNDHATTAISRSAPKEPDYIPVLLFAFTPAPENSLPDITLVPLTARFHASKNKLSNIGRLDELFGGYSTIADVPLVSQEDSDLIRITKARFQASLVVEAIRKAGVDVPRWIYSITVAELTESGLRAAQLYLGGVWEEIFHLLKGKRTVLSANSHHHINSMTRIDAIPEPARVELQLTEKDEKLVLECFVMLENERVALEKVKRFGFWLVLYKDNMYRFGAWKDAELSRQFDDAGKISVRSTQIEPFLSHFVLPLMQDFPIELNIGTPIQYQPLQYSNLRIYLKEDDSHLLLLPVFAYRSVQPDQEDILEFGMEARKNKVSYENNTIIIWERDPESERQALSWMEGLHPDFQEQPERQIFDISFENALKDNWLYRFFEMAAEAGIEVFGFAQLKNFRYNPNRPAFKIRSSSGIDWFDMQMEITFGNQIVSLNDIKKALVKKQNYVQLADGTIGMLPEEWLEKYASLFKFGQVKNDTVQVSKLHFSLIDDLYEHIDNEKVQQEIREKKMKLLAFKEIKDVQLPKNSSAQLRDYQLEGVKWLKFLEEFNWGGCLADDMGLGKTLQVLTFLQMRKETNPQSVHLVVVPTTLIFNWQAEVEKFAPELRIFVHRGIGRHKNTNAFSQHDIILTTYGTLRSDIEHLKDFQFDYVVLDESQAIKNPNALTSKAVKLLLAFNRIVMTGTPVENNTFDLYSQMDFANPGLLGAQDFFRTEFATPIDKYRDEYAATMLRKLIHPFILKRTKDEVAKDLPDKTEMTLFCEMGKKQRKVYETYREVYRQKIADKMAADGKEKAAFLILEGLLKLRQICDSPALLSDDADYGDDSAKLDEIIREIEENAGHHKILIFSQFLKMLDLIKTHLEKVGIPYEYLDGSTQDRALRVRRFQDNEHCRVFLMSLKAGGVGINLTEADYVYLIDPWWNPAVEQQAIDRAHRIGQTKKVFAYKMICKDTIEEKILLLQDKKKGIAKELISTEQGFIKKLTKEDVIGLFS